MPLYSGIAARINYSNVDPLIPSSRQLASQAGYWKRNYNGKRGKGTAMKFIYFVLTLKKIYGNGMSTTANDCAMGKKMFKKYGADAHTVTAGGKHKTGPNLFGICGRPAANSPGYFYTDAMRNKGIIWDEANLDKFLKNPKRFIPGTKMVFAGIKKRKVRRQLVHYLCYCIQQLCH